MMQQSSRIWNPTEETKKNFGLYNGQSTTVIHTFSTAIQVSLGTIRGLLKEIVKVKSTTIDGTAITSKIIRVKCRNLLQPVRISQVTTIFLRLLLLRWKEYSTIEKYSFFFCDNI